MRGNIVLATILLLACALRTYGLNWDQNRHIHPDERFLTMVATSARIPESFADYLDPFTSTLNPYNLDFEFFVYGTLPLTLTKISAVLIGGLDTYDGITLTGRFISAIADMGTLIMVYLIARAWERQYELSSRMKYWSAGLYGVAVLPIQNAHFFTVDSILVFFLMGAVFFALRSSRAPRFVNTCMAGACMGCALGSKASALYIMPLVIAVGTFIVWRVRAEMSRKLFLLVFHGALFVIALLISYRIADPHVFASANVLNLVPSTQFLANIEELQSLTDPQTTFPPSLQWVSKSKIIFPLVNMVVFGLGVPFALLACWGMFLAGLTRKPIVVLVLVWMAGFFLYQGTRFVTSMRYFYPLYPFLALFAGWALTHIQTKHYRGKLLLGGVVIALLIWPLSFMSIYSKPHTYIQASQWMQAHARPNSQVLAEHWNDALPYQTPETNFTITEIPIFAPDTPDKISEVTMALEAADYYIIPNNRSYGSLLPLADQFPFTAKFFDDLFADRGSYELVREFVSYPELRIGSFVLSFPDQWAEEAFTVYDHPRVMIFRKR